MRVSKPGGRRDAIYESAGFERYPGLMEPDEVAQGSPKDAERIVRGVLNNEDRILIGADAWLLERIQRWMPVRYFRLMQPILERMTREGSSR